ncbi:MAG TPA: phage Gp37/Gp68 family protein [Rubricoccaceae bacterium]|jgi:protein gp37
MAENSNIEWTDHTFNPWRGCDKVSPGCDHCYAETLSKRNPAVLGIWGKDGARPVAAEAYWKQPEKWNRQAEAEGVRRRVFCLSLGDVFEYRDDLVEPRLRLFDLIRRTPHLDWLLLSKRPKNIRLLLSAARYQAYYDCHFTETEGRSTLYQWLLEWEGGNPPANVWLGTSVEDQERAEQRVPALLKVPAAVRFLSCEPLLGPVNLDAWLTSIEPGTLGDDYDGNLYRVPDNQGIDWVIVGGESGHGARPMHPDWARSLRDQCEVADVALFFKQWGEWYPYNGADETLDRFAARPDVAVSQTGALWSNCTAADLHTYGLTEMIRLGKKEAGNLLDGIAHKAFPTQPAASSLPLARVVGLQPQVRRPELTPISRKSPW